jgi:AcrR family transcriptional regulator
MNTSATRLSAAERREAVLEAALHEFAERGYEGTSTEDIARRVGISQPYLFRLFGTKKQLFKAAVARCFRETLERFQRASEGLRGAEALEAMAEAYMEMLANERHRLRAQMQAYAACEDPDICEAARNGYGDLVAYVERVTGLPQERITKFFATGMLLNVLATMDLDASPEPWSDRLIAGLDKQCL